MHIKDLRSLTPEALQSKLSQIQLDLSIEKRKIASTGVQTKKAKIREMKRTIAQIKTLLKERGVST
ncbi:MAG: 50S ribosomal protein L29 [Candidatus Micrarchaeia archaeon]|jgi:ribosomal protein L29